MLVLLYGYETKEFFHGLYEYENKDFFHGPINTQTILKFPDKLIRKRAPTTAVPRRTVRRLYSSRAALNEKHTAYCIADLAETLRPTALPHDNALHL